MSRSYRVPLGWSYYLPGEEYTPTHVLAPTVKDLTAWFRGAGAPLLNEVDYTSKHRVELEWEPLRHNGVEGFQWAVENKPQEALAAIGIALFSALFSQGNGAQDPDMVPAPTRRITPRILHYQDVLSMKYLKSNRIGKFVSISGTVVRVSTIRPMLLSVKFFCQKCNAETEQAPPPAAPNRLFMVCSLGVGGLGVWLRGYGHGYRIWYIAMDCAAETEDALLSGNKYFSFKKSARKLPHNSFGRDQFCSNFHCQLLKEKYLFPDKLPPHSVAPSGPCQHTDNPSSVCYLGGCPRLSSTDSLSCSYYYTPSHKISAKSTISPKLTFP
ncbi:hypothetical protein T484DRAFT_2802723 [Baffinella frigidus]|nr:hypothetical protein T484DRAFT_2802723 [Cryptophyta sp. CCMP2293]